MKTTIILLALLPCMAWSQQEISYDSTTDVHRFAFRGQLYDYRADNQQSTYRTVAIKGSPFLFKDWQTSSLPTHRGDALHFPLNYNIMEDYVVVSMASAEKIIYPESFEIKDRIFIRLRNQYFEAVYTGRETKLLRRYNARLDKVERNGYNENVKYDYEYSKSEDLFLQESDGNIIPVKLNERNLLSKLPDAKTARQIIREHKLNLRREEDLLVLLTKLEQ
ncbi:hypothetical protein [Persicitalea sp.]|uniref:hypothetical protein n=1 Tax=Persicitalea sp. TaxID=3100273 RepID=UPI0035930958